MQSPSHAQYVEWRGEDPKACKVVLSDWPYECPAKDKHPRDLVYVCETHRCWWHEPFAMSKVSGVQALRTIPGCGR